MTDTKREELLELAHGYIEKRLSVKEVTRLEEWLDSDKEARRVFTDFSHDHAVLHWESIPDSEEGESELEDVSEFRPRRLPTLWQTFAAAAVICLLALVLMRPAGEPVTFATMTSTEAARWESGTLPTSEGARLGQGSLKLVRGLATIQFDSGAEVILEAPAELELLDTMSCTLVTGTAVAEVDKGAQGFTVHTPTAHVIDYGTRFAVNVHPQTGATQTQVFDGLVEVKLPDEDKGIWLETGQRTFVSGDALGEVSEGLEEGIWAPSPGWKPLAPNWKQITTADAKGRDTYVWGGKPNDHVSDQLLLLKNSSDLAGPHRKAYLGFDLSGINDSEIDTAELILRFTPTGWGLASHLGSSDFQVWGLGRDSLDHWEHGELDWSSAPANELSSGSELLKEHATLLGEFSVPRGIQTGNFGIRGKTLAEFLNQDSNQFATLVITRRTAENRGGGLVHAFASKRHPFLPAPTLRVKVK